MKLFKKIKEKWNKTKEAIKGKWIKTLMTLALLVGLFVAPTVIDVFVGAPVVGSIVITPTDPPVDGVSATATYTAGGSDSEYNITALWVNRNKYNITHLWVFDEASGNRTVEWINGDLEQTMSNNGIDTTNCHPSQDNCRDFESSGQFLNSTTLFNTTQLIGSEGSLVSWSDNQGSFGGSASQFIFGYRPGNSGNRRLYHVYTNNGNISSGIGSNFFTTDVLMSVNDNMLATTWNGTDFILYHNTTVANSFTYSFDDGLSETYIGNRENGDRDCDCAVSWVFISNRELTASEIADIYNGNLSWSAETTESIANNTELTQTFDAANYTFNDELIFMVEQYNGSDEFDTERYTANVSEDLPPSVTSLTETPDPVEANAVIELNATVVDNSTIDTVIVQTTAPNSTKTNQTMTLNNGKYFNLSADTTQIGTYTTDMYVNDTQGNVNSTESSSYVVQDTRNPNVTSATETPDPVKQGGTIKVNVTILDNVAFDSCIVQANFTNGTFTNYTGTIASTQCSNSSITTATVAVVTLRWFVNDTSGNINNTVTSSFEVLEADPPAVTNITFTPSQRFNESGGIINMTANVADATGVGTVIFQITYSNGTKTNFSTTAAGSVYWNASFFSGLIGNHTGLVVANDTLGSLNNTESGTYEVIGYIFSFTASLGTAISNMIFVPNITTVNISLSNSTNITLNWINETKVPIFNQTSTNPFINVTNTGQARFGLLFEINETNVNFPIFCNNAFNTSNATFISSGGTNFTFGNLSNGDFMEFWCWQDINTTNVANPGYNFNWFVNFIADASP